MSSSVSEMIRAFEREREAELDAALELANEQRYGERPIIEDPEPARPWEDKIGTAEAIRSWRQSFICLRIRGYAIFNEPPVKYDDDDDEPEEAEKRNKGEWSSSSDEGDFERVQFWNDTCNVNPFDNDDDEELPSGNAWHDIQFRNDAVDESKIFGQKKAPLIVEKYADPDLTLCVVGTKPPRRDYQLFGEDDGDILAIHGECPDYIVKSDWNETPPPDPDDEFPPPVIDPPKPDTDDELTSEDYRKINEAVLVLESLSPHWGPGPDDDDPLDGVLSDEFEGFDDQVYDDDDDGFFGGGGGPPSSHLSNNDDDSVTVV